MTKVASMAFSCLFFVYSFLFSQVYLGQCASRMTRAIPDGSPFVAPSGDQAGHTPDNKNRSIIERLVARWLPHKRRDF